MKHETRTATEFFELCRRIDAGEFSLRAVTVGRLNSWYIFETIDPPEPEPTTPNEVLKRLLK